MVWPGPRHAEPAIPFLCIGLAALWTLAPRFIRTALALLSLYGAGVTLIAVSTMPLPPADIHRPVQELMVPAFIDGDLSLNTQTFVAGSVDANFRAHRQPKAAFDLGMEAGLRGHASLLPLAIVWIACGAALIDASRRGERPPRQPTSSQPATPGFA